MKLKWFINTTAIALLIMVALLGLAKHDSVMAAQDEGSKIEGLLLDRFSADGSADFIVRFTEQADLSAADAMDWNSRGEFVYNSLLDTATRSQANAKSILDGHGFKNETLIGGNDLYVWSGNLEAANELAALPEVSFIRATRIYYIDPIVVVKPFDNLNWAGDFLVKNALTTVGASPDATTAWGITDTKADQAWLLGARGSGMKVANIDTGVQWNHPALVTSFACASGNDANCWEDPSNICGGTACDNNGHGTHTMGSMVAEDDPSLTYIAGMAPDATWIACKGCETNSCSDFALTSCADWILAPNGNPSLRPNVVNNSWGGGSGDPWYQAYVQSWVAGGVFPAFSAGNSGSGCNTLGSPGDYQESFGSAAHDVGRNIASFSSRGPSPVFGHDPYTKPNISAPGVSVCSTVPTNQWSCGYSGTSMASPHTAGAVAQLWSCAPSLVGQIDATFQALVNSTDPAPAGNCGAPPDGEGNYTFGYGYLNALNLVSLNCGGVELGTLEGHVYDQDMNPVEGATVTAQTAPLGNGINATTDPNGFYSMDLIVGTYDVTASKTNYTSQTVAGVVVAMGETTVQDFTITFLGAWTQLSLGLNCPDWTRMDMEYYAGTGLAYIMGGRSSTTYLGDIYSYDPATNTCADTGQNMPIPVSNYTILKLNNGVADLLCTFGGGISQTAPFTTDAVQCYDPIANSVSQVSTLPGQLGLFNLGGSAAVNNVAYVFGGFRNDTTPYHHVETWSWVPETNTWTQEGNLNLARGYIQVAVVDGKIYGFGGNIWDGAALNAQTRAEVFDPATQSWDDAAVTDLTIASGEGRGFGFDSDSMFNLAGLIVLAGGGQWPNDTNAVLSYDVATNTYDDGFANLNISRRDHAGFFMPGDPGRMYVFGGRSSAVGYGGDSPPYGPPEYFEVAFNAEPEPDIAVDPAALDATLLADSTVTIPLTITNNGDAPLDWSIVEVPGTRIAKAAAGDPRRLSPTGVAAPAAPNASPLVDVIADGSFEAGTPSPYWTEYSTNFGTPLCDVPDCGFGGGTGPRTGGWWAWFGGIDLAYEEGYVYQDVTLDPGDATLSFWLETASCDSADDYLEVLVDGTQVFFVDGANPACGLVGYTLQTVNLSAYADGGVHEIQFHSETFSTNGGVGNFFVDDVALNNVPGVDWLSEDPIAGELNPGESQVVIVTFDSTGLALGEYQASLDISSNDPQTPSVEIPVTLSVVENAHVAVAHLAPFAMDPGTAVTITLNGTPALTDFAFADSTIYLDLFPGEYLVEVWPMGAVEPAITATVDLAGGTDYSVVAVGDGDNQPLELIALVDDNTPPAAGKFHLRLGHLAPFAATGTEADICLQDGTAILTNVPYGAVAPYLPLDAGTYDLVIAAAGTACGVVLIDPLPVTFTEGQIVTAFAVGNGTLQDLGVFAWPSDVVGFLLPLMEGYTIYLPLVMK